MMPLTDHSYSTNMQTRASLIPESFFTGVGAWLVGTWISAVLEGVLLQQTFRYFQLYRSDSWFLKAWVLFVVLSQTADTALTMHTAYFYLVTNYFNPTVIIQGAAISAKVLPFVGAVTNFAVELFYVRRVYLLGHRYRYSAISSLLLVLTGVAFSFVLGVETFTIPSLEKDTSNGGLAGSAIASPAFLLAADLQLTCVLIYALYTSRGSFSSTNRMINMLVLYTVSSGFLICIINFISMVLAISLPHSVIFTVASVVGGQVYSNSFIVALNTRRLIRKEGEKPSTVLSPSRSNALQGGPGSGTDVGGMEMASMAFAKGTVSHGDSTAVLDFALRTRSTMGGEGERDGEGEKPDLAEKGSV